MECPSCGRENADNHNFCFYCGFNLKDFDPETEDNSRYTKAIINGNIHSEVSQSAAEVKGAEPMKTWQWALYFGMFVIPFFWMLWLILTCVWAFGSKGSEERKRLAKGLLMVVLITVVLAIIMVIYIVNVYGMDELIRLISNGTASTLDEYLGNQGLK